MGGTGQLELVHIKNNRVRNSILWKLLGRGRGTAPKTGEEMDAMSSAEVEAMALAAQAGQADQLEPLWNSQDRKSVV